MKALFDGDPELEVHADIDHHSDSPQQLGIQEAEPVFGPLHIAKLAHEPLRIQRPPLTVAADPYAALEACQPILPVAHLADLEMMARYPLVVAGGDLSPERKDGPSLGYHVRPGRLKSSAGPV